MAPGAEQFRVPSRLARRLEVEAMRATFDNTFKLVVPHNGLLYWEGQVELNLATLRQQEHWLKIVYPNDYPNRPAATLDTFSGSRTQFGRAKVRELCEKTAN